MDMNKKYVMAELDDEERRVRIVREAVDSPAIGRRGLLIMPRTFLGVCVVKIIV